MSAKAEVAFSKRSIFIGIVVALIAALAVSLAVRAGRGEREPLLLSGPVSASPRPGAALGCPTPGYWINDQAPLDPDDSVVDTKDFVEPVAAQGSLRSVALTSVWAPEEGSGAAMTVFITCDLRAGRELTLADLFTNDELMQAWRASPLVQAFQHSDPLVQEGFRSAKSVGALNALAAANTIRVGGMNEGDQAGVVIDLKNFAIVGVDDKLSSIRVRLGFGNNHGSLFALPLDVVVPRERFEAMSRQLKDASGLPPLPPPSGTESPFEMVKDFFAIEG